MRPEDLGHALAALTMIAEGHDDNAQRALCNLDDYRLAHLKGYAERLAYLCMDRQRRRDFMREAHLTEDDPGAGY